MTGFNAALSVLGELLAASPANGQRLERASVTGITTDTRSVQAGDLFVALEGDRFNGHDFVGEAVEKGAIAAVVRKGVCAKDSHLPLLEVDDTLAAYQTLGRWWRQQCKASVIAITGSVGKTTTKEIIAAALSQFGSVLKTQANYNNEIGVPKTLLGLTTEHDYAVVEMGMRGPGEIALLAQIAQPDVALITNVGTAHIGRLGSREAIAQAKCELLQKLPPTSVAVLNHDNDLLMSTAASVWSGAQISYGLEGGDVRGALVGDRILINQVAIPLPLPGRHNALNLLGTVATLKALNLDWQKLAQGLSVSMPAGRAQTHHLPNDIVLLDETYNAGTESMLAALQLLADQPGTRRIAVLGTMKELGDQSISLHRQIGEAVAAHRLDQLLILADPDEAEAIAQGANPVPAERFASRERLAAHLQGMVQAGDRILFKASRSVELDQVVDQLLTDLTQDFSRKIS
ncbi:MAG: UDP-N-acetylmuramoyl-tripeptide--D-alanyl-D-alanine ligase [Phormidesmis sp.]